MSEEAQIGLFIIVLAITMIFVWGYATAKRKFKKVIDQQKETINELEISIKAVEEAEEYANFDISEIGTVEEVSQSLKEARDQLKSLKSNQTATKVPNLTFDGSAKKGQAIMKKVSKLVLAAFEGEINENIKAVKHNNLTATSLKIQKTADKYGRMLAPNFTVEITPAFIKAKRKELKEYHILAVAKQAQKEAEQAFREELREEERAIREHAANVAETEKKAKDAQLAYDKAFNDLSGLHTAELDALRLQLEEALENSERAVSQAQLTRKGHIYVIKNTGSFGDDVYKIGMTRRLIPDERIKELSGASVPFPFAVCAMFTAEDAPTLEKDLHNSLSEFRMNKVNQRKEFFKVPLNKIVDEVRSKKGDVIFNMHPEEIDYENSI